MSKDVKDEKSQEKVEQLSGDDEADWLAVDRTMQNLEPLISEKVGRVTKNAENVRKWWWKFFALIFAPIVVGEIFLRSHYGRVIQAKSIPSKKWLFLDIVLKVIFWPEALIKDFPQQKMEIEAAHFVFWVILLTITIPLLFPIPPFLGLSFLSSAHTFAALAAIVYVSMRMFLRELIDVEFKQISAIQTASASDTSSPKLMQTEPLVPSSPVVSKGKRLESDSVPLRKKLVFDFDDSENEDPTRTTGGVQKKPLADASRFLTSKEVPVAPPSQPGQKLVDEVERREGDEHTL